MRKFKVGDRVKIVSDHVDYMFLIGTYGKVVGERHEESNTDSANDTYTVKLDISLIPRLSHNGSHSNNNYTDNTRTMFAYELELCRVSRRVGRRYAQI